MKNMIMHFNYIKMIITGLVMTLCLSACNSEDMIEESSLQQECRSTMSRSISPSKTTLEFATEADFLKAISEIESLNSVQEKKEWVNKRYPHFTSLMDIYEQAGLDAATMGETKEEFYSFVEKYDNSLYIPLVGEDAGFYLPIKRHDVAYLVNENCNVTIGNTILNKKDIDSYQDLMDNGDAYYANTVMTTSTTEEFTFDSDVNSIGTEYDSGWKEYGDRKVKLKARKQIVDSEMNLHTEFCFRKHSFLGWVNYTASSTIVGTASNGTPAPIVINAHEKATSSHDHLFPCPMYYATYLDCSVYTVPELNVNVTVSFSGISETLQYSWTMAPSYTRCPAGVRIYRFRPLIP